MANNIKVFLNKPALLREVVTSGQRRLSKEIQKLAQTEVDKKQKEMVREFESSSITKELLSGPESSGVSGLTGGYGNLFTFIGFEKSQNPINPIRKILNRRSTVQAPRISQTGKFVLNIGIPDKKDIFSSTPLPWASGSSWVEGIEKGISNFGSYFYNSSSGIDASRSGRAVQTKNDFGRTIKTSPYITAIFEKFKNNLRKL